MAEFWRDQETYRSGQMSRGPAKSANGSYLWPCTPLGNSLGSLPIITNIAHDALASSSTRFITMRTESYAGGTPSSYKAKFTLSMPTLELVPPVNAPGLFIGQSGKSGRDGRLSGQSGPHVRHSAACWSYSRSYFARDRMDTAYRRLACSSSGETLPSPIRLGARKTPTRARR